MTKALPSFQSGELDKNGFNFKINIFGENVDILQQKETLTILRFTGGQRYKIFHSGGSPVARYSAY